MSILKQETFFNTSMSLHETKKYIQSIIDSGYHIDMFSYHPMPNNNLHYSCMIVASKIEYKFGW